MKASKINLSLNHHTLLPTIRVSTADVRNKAVVPLLSIHCLLLLALFVCVCVCVCWRGGGYVLSSLCCAVLSVFYRFAIFLLVFYVIDLCHVTVSSLCFFRTVPRVGMQCVIVAILGHTQSFFFIELNIEKY